MEKRFLDRRLEQMHDEGTKFETSVEVGKDLDADELKAENDAVILAIGATQWRDLPVKGRELEGIYQAMEYLVPANHVAEGKLDEHPFPAAGKNVIIIGGGDTGADCLGTAHRHGAASIHQFEIMPEPPENRDISTPWPTWPMMLRTSSAHDEGGERVFSISTKQFIGENNQVTSLETIEVEIKHEDGRMNFVEISGTEQEYKADLVFLALGFTGPEQSGVPAELGVDLDNRGNIVRDENWMSTENGVFVAGDAGRGQSLIVWAIAEGRACAASVDQWLEGNSLLPKPVTPHSQQLR